MAAKHFREKLHRSFAYVGPAGVPFSLTRQGGFAKALGLGELPTHWMDGGKGSWDAELRRLQGFLRGLPTPTAGLAADDFYAGQVHEQISRHVHLSSPLHGIPLCDPSRIVITAGLYDKVSPARDLFILSRRWSGSRLLRVRQGHFGYLALRETPMALEPRIPSRPDLALESVNK